MFLIFVLLPKLKIFPEMASPQTFFALALATSVERPRLLLRSVKTEKSIT